MNAEMIGGLLRRILGSIGEGPDPVTKLGKFAAERQGLAAQRLLRRREVTEHCLNALADPPLAEGEFSGGCGMFRLQGELGLGCAGLAGRGSQLLRLRSFVGQLTGKCLEGKGGLRTCLGERVPDSAGSPGDLIAIRLQRALRQLGRTIDALGRSVFLRDCQPGKLTANRFLFRAGADGIRLGFRESERPLGTPQCRHLRALRLAVRQAVRERLGSVGGFSNRSKGGRHWIWIWSGQSLGSALGELDRLILG